VRQLQTKTTTEGTLSLTYDAWDQLTQANKTWANPESYAYDDLGRRIRETVKVRVRTFVVGC